MARALGETRQRSTPHLQIYFQSDHTYTCFTPRAFAQHHIAISPTHLPQPVPMPAPPAPSSPPPAQPHRPPPPTSTTDQATDSAAVGDSPGDRDPERRSRTRNTAVRSRRRPAQTSKKRKLQQQHPRLLHPSNRPRNPWTMAAHAHTRRTPADPVPPPRPLQDTPRRTSTSSPNPGIT